METVIRYFVTNTCRCYSSVYHLLTRRLLSPPGKKNKSVHDADCIEDYLNVINFIKLFSIVGLKKLVTDVLSAMITPYLIFIVMNFNELPISYCSYQSFRPGVDLHNWLDIPGFYGMVNFQLSMGQNSTKTK